jgi:hypothetical protein
MRCSACGAPYHPATGHIFSERTRLCGACARAWVAWLRQQLARRWGGLRFYEYAATSIVASKEAGQEPCRSLS